ncbi:MAG: transcriptional/translational regulatory protein YebC/TACO1, partial [Pseudohongiellaceae bacterium]
EIQFVPQATTALEGEDRATMEKLVELLDDCDDVQRIYHSGELA